MGMNGVEYTVEDTGNFARYGVQFDVYYGDHASASAHGHQTWEAYIADDNGSQEVEVTTAETVNRLNTTLTNHDLDSVLKSRMNGEEEERYGYYNLTYGNRDYLFDLDTLPAGDGFGYQIPSEALSDEKFARMITEAEAAAEAASTEAVEQTETAAETESEPVIDRSGSVEEGTTFSVSGNGEVLDDISGDSTKEFYTIRTANNNTFYMVTDKSSTTENVYMRSVRMRPPVRNWRSGTRKWGGG